MRTNTVLMSAAVALLASSASAQITGSAHDFSSMAWSGGEICLPCHTPHFAMAGLPRLWNHTMSSATYTMHEGPGDQDDFDYRSRMCLSCHDGTVALDSFGGMNGTSYMPASANLGTDFTNDHPVGSDAQYPPDPQPSWWSGSMKDPSQIPSAIRLREWVDDAGVSHNVVSCTSCHNVHNRGNYDHMLVMSNSASALCLGCHIK